MFALAAQIRHLIFTGFSISRVGGLLWGMATDYSEEIAALEEIVNTATRGVSVDGLSVNIDVLEARKRLAELKALDPANHRVRPVTSKIRLPFQ
jgi:hypothetical protein